MECALGKFRWYLRLPDGTRYYNTRRHFGFHHPLVYQRLDLWETGAVWNYLDNLEPNEWFDADTHEYFGEDPRGLGIELY